MLLVGFVTCMSTHEIVHVLSRTRSNEIAREGAEAACRIWPWPLKGRLSRPREMYLSFANEFHPPQLTLPPFVLFIFLFPAWRDSTLRIIIFLICYRFGVVIGVNSNFVIRVIYNYIRATKARFRYPAMPFRNDYWRIRVRFKNDFSIIKHYSNLQSSFVILQISRIHIILHSPSSSVWIHFQVLLAICRASPEKPALLMPDDFTRW